MSSNCENECDPSHCSLIGDNCKLTYNESCVPLDIPEDILNELVDKAKDYALMHGACMRSKTAFDRDTLQFAPFFLLPSAFPKREFERVVKFQPIMNKLIHHVAQDYEFLKKCLKKTIMVDDFTSRLWKIYETVRSEGISQPHCLGLLRSDYFYNVPTLCAKQVETNTIASSFGALSPKFGDLHRYILGELGKEELLSKLPENNALEALCDGMIEAWKIYGNPKAVVLFVIEDVTYNICDQRFHEFEIRRQNPDVHVIRRNLTEISKRGKLTDDKRLIIDDKEVAVVYFRAGYEPAQYHTDVEWDARLLIERSLALKSPTISYHLAGTKKVQQELAMPGVLERYISEEESKLLSQLFTGLYSLDLHPEGDKAVEMAIEYPEKYVLKPQREGGGNNIYGEEIRTVLKRVQHSSEREAYILMDRIRPPILSNYVVRPHEPVKLIDVVSELGIFGVIIGTKDKIMVNKNAGHMLRTKMSTVNEGGVAAGQGGLDSVYLTD
ncbi:glutathione synthetase-like isoform X2 [Oratosquilla oratoria]|uniref:glutathione synthetase-like isoform X2 n=1 Tax=Oratosquilla oratoria TaxID=337810 RepID=UPI003F76B592